MTCRLKSAVNLCCAVTAAGGKKSVMEEIFRVLVFIDQRIYPTTSNMFGNRKITSKLFVAARPIEVFFIQISKHNHVILFLDSHMYLGGAYPICFHFMIIIKRWRKHIWTPTLDSTPQAGLFGHIRHGTNNRSCMVQQEAVFCLWNSQKHDTSNILDKCFPFAPAQWCMYRLHHLCQKIRLFHLP